ncbi:MAG: DUF3473 domain-containing protein, partial [Thermoanaerobaculia bacterium]
ETGFVYDSSLTPCPLAGRPGNPRFASRLSWDGRAPDLLEFPPLTFCGPLRLPAGSWTGRLVNPERLVRAVFDHSEEGGMPVAVVHPWEISGRPTPGALSGIAKFIHETGRLSFVPRFRELLRGLPWTSIRTAAGLESLASIAPLQAVAASRRAG